MADHAVDLAVAGGIQALEFISDPKVPSKGEKKNSLVVVDVQLGVRVRSTGGLESDAHVVLTNDLVEVAVTEGAVLVEDFVDDILKVDSQWDGFFRVEPWKDLPRRRSCPCSGSSRS